MSALYKFLYPVNIYLFKFNDRNIRKRHELCSKLTTKTLEQFIYPNANEILHTKIYHVHVKGCISDKINSSYLQLISLFFLGKACFQKKIKLILFIMLQCLGPPLNFDYQHCTNFLIYYSPVQKIGEGLLIKYVKAYLEPC